MNMKSAVRFPRVPVYLGLCALLLWFLLGAETVRSAALEALALCARSVVPALLPFLIVSRLLIALGFGPWLSPHMAGFMGPLFALPGSAGAAVLLGLVGGYPLGAETAAELYRQGQLSRNEAERLLCFCNNSNPVFLLTVLGLGVFGDFRVGLWLWLIHLLSALLVGVLLGRRKPERRSRPPEIACQAVSFSSALSTSISRAGLTMLSICACVVFFSVLLRPLLAFSGPLAALPVGIVELFSMTPLLVPDRAGLVIAAFCSGWGGLSVLCQTAAVLEGSGLSLLPCVRGKALQALLSGLMAAFLSSCILP